jgi:thioesterase domain-containing protein
VKIKGYRIEPAGVAALLREINGVDEAVVVPREAAFGAKQLVGFLRGDQRLSEAELHHAAARLMPDYMLPGAFSWVDEFPLTANGKLDVPALLTRLDAQRGAACEAQASDEVELRLAKFWRRNGARVGFDLDTPFDEVCDSLAMIGVMLDIEAAFGRPLPPSALVPPITIRSMAAAMRTPEPTRTRPVRAFYVAQPWNINPPPQAIAAALDDDGEWLEIGVPPTASSASAYDSVEAMGAILEAQVLAASERGPYTLAGHSFGGVLAFELARRLERRGEQVSRLVLLDSFLARRRTLLDRARVRLRSTLLHARGGPRDAWARLAKRGRPAFRKEKRNRAEQIRDRCLKAMFSYTPEPIGAPAVLVRCTRYKDAFDRPENSPFDLTSPWASLVDGLTIAEFDCTHAEIVLDPGWASKVADYLRAALKPVSKSVVLLLAQATLALGASVGLYTIDGLEDDVLAAAAMCAVDFPYVA